MKDNLELINFIVAIESIMDAPENNYEQPTMPLTMDVGHTVVSINYTEDLYLIQMDNFLKWLQPIYLNFHLVASHALSLPPIFYLAKSYSDQSKTHQSTLSASYYHSIELLNQYSVHSYLIPSKRNLSFLSRSFHQHNFELIKIIDQ